MSSANQIRLAQRIYELETENARLQRKIAAGPHRKWFETDDPEVIKCMGSHPACAKNGCQYRKVMRRRWNIVINWMTRNRSQVEV